MKKQTIAFLLGLAFALCACHQETDSIIGKWEVDKVKVQFDENNATPELVKQIGEMEQKNVLVIATDSTLTLKAMDGERQGRLSLKGDGTLLFDGIVFGTYKNGEIVTKSDSPLGEVIVSYRKD